MIVGNNMKRKTPLLTIPSGRICVIFVRSPKTKRPPALEKSRSLLIALPSQKKISRPIGT